MPSKNCRDSGQISQSELSEMGLAVVAQFSKRLVARDQDRLGGCAETATARVARRLRAAPGTFTNIIRQRVKKVSADLRDRIVSAALADIQQEIERLEHEKRLLEAMGFGPSCDDYRAAEAALATARDCLARMRGQP
ncbi:hypothetical protein [Bosea sp. (in: a-proteobacteria)]|uniref:hypothetical protein n=1 Tax=Bosea sp. (in: a-proteobacteria) TaxID=1871050 RepID=UPI002608393D|nr:hypothetical protein [Bosea sp. (in: a-proteobacteria)]MCO5092643.1 hypothetical protein [Bosea sp. (in: a-proteobacteria)]